MPYAGVQFNRFHLRRSYGGTSRSVPAAVNSRENQKSGSRWSQNFPNPEGPRVG